MKKIIVGIMLAMVLSVPSLARANFFDGSGDQWWMDPSWWASGASGGVSMAENGDNLGATATGTGGAYYNSQWGLNLKNNFSVQVDYHYDHTGSEILSGLALEFYLPWQSQKYGATSYTLGVANLSSSPEYATAWSKFGTANFELTPRSVVDGTLYANYTSANRNLTLSTGAYSKTFNLNDAWGKMPAYFLPTAQIYFQGTSNGGGVYSADQAYFSNFQINEATIYGAYKPTTYVNPEPVSSLLFLLGGGLLAARRIRKKK